MTVCQGNTVVDLVCDGDVNVLHMETLAGCGDDGMDVIIEQFDSI